MYFPSRPLLPTPPPPSFTLTRKLVNYPKRKRKKTPKNSEPPALAYNVAPPSFSALETLLFIPSLFLEKKSPKGFFLSLISAKIQRNTATPSSTIFLSATRELAGAGKLAFVLESPAQVVDGSDSSFLVTAAAARAAVALGARSAAICQRVRGRIHHGARGRG